MYACIIPCCQGHNLLKPINVRIHPCMGQDAAPCLKIGARIMHETCMACIHKRGASYLADCARAAHGPDSKPCPITAPCARQRRPSRHRQRLDEPCIVLSLCVAAPGLSIPFRVKYECRPRLRSRENQGFSAFKIKGSALLKSRDQRFFALLKKC
jgi:hypothetical protein